ncbi:histidinol-phosphate transaminase [Lentiprolixibacter aurantiacus]|uniref:Histidinol-phosphate aminotransferase n=1 Tax=Lentiprolixibacter aurantiacus TaxID=2993939 RepID=A0AAE3SNE3_9FLAO|nr:histidinol-phosphate transaminase [Lentiprolixibacter aurantiacus]MCX2719549.1 histidinol-phosphate transaminase [Lentiprolixibacter aurantiacus]
MGFDLNSITRENVRDLKPYSSARDEYTDSGADMVFLDANENPFDNGLNRYPDPQQRILKQKLADIKGVPSSFILLGNGSDEVLDLIFRAFCEPHKDNVITAPPTYGMYKVLAGINAVENREVYLTNGFSLDVEAMLAAADKNSKIIFISSPNNPTANRFDDTAIRKLLENFDGLVVIDEAYIDFSTEGSWIRKLEDHPNLIVTQTFSKALGMAGIRLGVAYASQAIIDVLNKIKPPYNVNALTQLRAMEQLNNTDLNASQLGQILDERKKLMAALPGIPCIKQVFESDANFILARVDDAGKRYDELIAKGIVVRNRSTQPLCENTLRFTVGTPEENVTLIKALKEL